jgi:aspartyl aminopeptidase
MTIPADAQINACDLLAFIDASPSPWHAVATAAERLNQQGFKALNETELWQLKTGGRYFVARSGSIIAFVIGQKSPLSTGFNMVGAHTDSPGFRLKPNAAFSGDGLIRIGIEVYGGPILATFADRDLSLAGQVNIRTQQGFDTHLVKFDEPIVRLPNLAIHMNREVNDKGLKFNKQTELPLLFGESKQGIDADAQFISYLADRLKVKSTDIINFELNVFDTQKGSIWGAHQEFIANSQLDNLASCHAALTAICNTNNPQTTSVCALFDHEEVGSESATGANGSFLANIVNRICLSQKMTQEEQLRALANSFFISADMAHAFHPNFAGSYEPCHHVHVNQGPVIKTNANHRYATDAKSAARFIQLCEQAGVPYQQYTHRTDLGCGSTIGPIVGASLGVACVDVGSPMWAMHSIRESAGVLDHHYIISVLNTYFK